MKPASDTQAPDVAPFETSRRTFCVRACQAVSLTGVGVLINACGGGGGGNPAGPSGPAAPPLPVVSGSVANGAVSVAVGGTALASVGGAALVQSPAGAFLVARTGDTAFSALTATCTHEACTITGRQNEVFVCPCHGSRFTNAGAVLNGPATRPLRQFTTEFAGDTLRILI